MSKRNTVALIEVEPGIFAFTMLKQGGIVFKHDLPEFQSCKPWVAQTSDVSAWAYGHSVQSACLNLRSKLYRLKKSS